MATKNQIIQQIGVIEKKLPNGEVKEFSQEVDDYYAYQRYHEDKMDKFNDTVTELNQALKTME